MAAPLNTCTTIEQHGVVRFLWEKIWKQRISTKKCCPCTVNIACHIRQSIIGCVSSRKGGQVSKMNIELVSRWRSPCRKCSDSNQKNFTLQVSRDLWNGGTSVYICMEIMLKNKCCLYVIISIRFFSITFCNLLIESPSYYVFKRFESPNRFTLSMSSTTLPICEILFLVCYFGTIFI